MSSRSHSAQNRKSSGAPGDRAGRRRRMAALSRRSPGEVAGRSTASLLPQPAGQHALSSCVLAKLNVRALGARDLQLRGWQLVQRELQLERVVCELLGLEAERDQAGDLRSKILGALAEKVEILPGLAD